VTKKENVRYVMMKNILLLTVQTKHLKTLSLTRMVMTIIDHILMTPMNLAGTVGKLVIQLKTVLGWSTGE